MVKLNTSSGFIIEWVWYHILVPNNGIGIQIGIGFDVKVPGVLSDCNFEFLKIILKAHKTQWYTRLLNFICQIEHISLLSST